MKNKSLSDTYFDDLNKEEYLYLKNDTSKYEFNNILYFLKSDKIFIVVTEKETLENCEKLKTNHYYDLKLKSVRPQQIINYRDYITSMHMYQNEIIDFEKGDKILWDLFITPDIKGSCYLPSNIIEVNNSASARLYRVVSDERKNATQPDFNNGSSGSYVE